MNFLKDHYRLFITIILVIGVAVTFKYLSDPTNPGHTSYWPETGNKSIYEKIYAYPIYQNKIKIINEYGKLVEIKSHHPNEELVKEIKDNLKRIPNHILENINERFIGIFLTENIASTGLVDTIFDDNRQPYYIMLLNVNKIKKKTNEWVNYRARSAFPEKFRKSINISMDKDDAKNTLFVILLHEFAHVYSYVNHILPIENYSNNRAPKAYPFIDISWDFNGRGVAYYKKGQMFAQLDYYKKIVDPESLAHPIKFYQELGKTNFTTLYSTYDFQEDFAEAFTLYYWFELTDNPYKVDISHRSGDFTLDIKDRFLKSEKFKAIRFLIEKHKNNRFKKFLN